MQQLRQRRRLICFPVGKLHSHTQTLIEYRPLCFGCLLYHQFHQLVIVRDTQRKSGDMFA